MKKKGLGIWIAAGLTGCSNPSVDNTETQKRIAVCEQIMQKYIVEAKIYERDRKRLVASCNISQKERTLAQWQCVLDAMDKGTKYADASDQCGKSGPAAK